MTTKSWQVGNSEEHAPWLVGSTQSLPFVQNNPHSPSSLPPLFLPLFALKNIFILNAGSCLQVDHCEVDTASGETFRSIADHKAGLVDRDDAMCFWLIVRGTLQSNH